MKPQRMLLSTLVTLFLASPIGVTAQTVDEADRPVRTNNKNPDAVAVVIGIADYQHMDIPDVDFAVNDATAIRSLLIDTLGYSSSRVLLRTNAEASLAQLRPLLRQELPATVVPGKTDVFVFYSGHGAPSADSRQAFLIPWDYNPRYAPSTDSAYPLKDFYQDLEKLRARHLFVVLDACFSGQSDSGSVVKDASPLLINVDNPAGSFTNGVVVTATGAQEIATWYRDRRHGLLTYYLLQAFKGEGADPNGRLSPATLRKYLGEKVPVTAREIRGRVQNPQVIAANSDETLVQLPVSAVRSGAAQLVETFGSLKITVDLGGDLYIDGIHQVNVPAGRAFLQQRIAAGPHRIEIRKEGYEPISEEVIVPPDRAADKYYSLRSNLAAPARLEPPIQPAAPKIASAPAPVPTPAPAPAAATPRPNVPVQPDEAKADKPGSDSVIWFMGQWPGLTIGFNPTIYLDGKPVGKLSDNRFFAVVLPPGRHYVNLTDDQPKADDEGWVDLAAGSQVFFKGTIQRVKIIANRPALVRVEETEALGQISRLKPIDAKNALDPRVITTFPEGKK